MRWLMDVSSGPQVAMNVAGTLIWVAVLALIVVRHRSGVRAVTKDYVALMISVFVAGVFVPIGPCWWLADYWRTRHHRVPGRPMAHEDSGAVPVAQ